MGCELWVRGVGENSGFVPVDTFVFPNWDPNNPDPVLTETGRIHPSGCLFYAADPIWQHAPIGWHSYPEFYTRGCADPDPLAPTVRHDCINGTCLPKTTYGTPGRYASRAACVGACARDSDCTGECVPVAEIAALRQAANRLKTKFCR